MLWLNEFAIQEYAITEKRGSKKWREKGVYYYNVAKRKTLPDNDLVFERNQADKVNTTNIQHAYWHKSKNSGSHFLPKTYV